MTTLKQLQPDDKPVGNVGVNELVEPVIGGEEVENRSTLNRLGRSR
jgi:hypothetical protein